MGVPQGVDFGTNAGKGQNLSGNASQAWRMMPASSPGRNVGQPVKALGLVRFTRQAGSKAGWGRDWRPRLAGLADGYFRLAASAAIFNSRLTWSSNSFAFCAWPCMSHSLACCAAEMRS